MRISDYEHSSLCYGVVAVSVKVPNWFVWLLTTTLVMRAGEQDIPPSPSRSPGYGPSPPSVQAEVLRLQLRVSPFRVMRLEFYSGYQTDS